jgi:hypothetical protein
LNRPLRDPNAELQELATNALGSPESVLDRHAFDEDPDTRIDARLARTGRAGLATPKDPKSLAVPPKQRLRLDQEERMPPTRKKPGDQDKQTTLVAAKDGALDAT